MMLHRSLFLAAFLLAPTVAAAQTIHGVVLDDASGEAIAGADVEVVSADGTRTVANGRTDRAGTFLLRLGGPGPFIIRATHLGFTSVESEPLDLRVNESVSVELRMAVEAIPLEPVTVTARGDRHGVAGFYERMRRPGAYGHFVTREQIDRRPGVWATNLLSMIPGVHLYPARGGGNLVMMRGSIGSTIAGRLPGGAVAHTVANQCEPTFYVDGTRMDQHITLDAYLKPNILEGIEIYPRGTGAPNSIVAMDACGVVAFWTREDERQPFTWRRLGAWLGGIALVFAFVAS